MYLRRLHIENSGPLDKLSLDMPFTTEGVPKPLVLVGTNGSGKTNLLSIIADALFEAAAVHYSDIVPHANSVNRPWFRINGGLTTRHGATGACALLEFDNDGSLVFIDKSGLLNPAELQARINESFHGHLDWPPEGPVKKFKIPDDVSKSIFQEGVYIYLPSSRSEIPHWLNRNSVHQQDFDLVPRFSKNLRKPIYVERGLEQLKQWMLALLIDTRMDVQVVDTPKAGRVGLGIGGIDHLIAQKNVWKSMNHILQLVMNDPTARFVWMGRGTALLGISRDSLQGSISIESLSAGQSTLLNMFGTILRYGDSTTPGGRLAPDSLVGICVIDEIDSHMHIDLQNRALPELIKMFPKIQFVVSSHSPIFALGMEAAFGENAISIIDMPSGIPIEAESYAEFGKALEALQHTQAFGRAILDFVGKPGKLSVLLEGETDPIYIATAVELLNRTELKDNVEFSWVGAKDPKNGQGFHTGKDALNATANVLRAKPELMKHPVLLLYDNDVSKEPVDFPSLFIRSMSSNNANTLVENGIENLLPETSIGEDMFDEKISKKKNATTVVTRSLNKMKLCNHLCKEKRDPTDFVGFTPILDMIAALPPVAKPDAPAI